MKRAVALVAALTLILAVAATALAATKVYYRTPFGRVAYKPKRITFSDATLKRIHWSHWNWKVAHGTGRARINDCNPDCASGRIVYGRATLTMFRRHREGGRRFYGCMTSKTRKNGHTYRIVWPPGCNR
jgi:hypothetical protein